MATGGGVSSSSKEASLGDDDMAEMYKVLFPLGDQSKQFGLQLGLSFKEIKAIHHQYSDPGERLMEILGIRICKSNRLTWKCIYIALKSECIGEHKLAKKIKKKYGHLFSPEPGSEHDTQEYGKREKGKEKESEIQEGKAVGKSNTVIVQERGSPTQDLAEEGGGRKMQTKSQRDSEKPESDEESTEISSGEDYVSPRTEKEREKYKPKKECEIEKEREYKNIKSVENREKSKREVESDAKFGKEKTGAKTQLVKNEKHERSENESSEMSSEKEIETLKSEDEDQIESETKEKESIKDTGGQSERKRHKNSKRKSKSSRKNQVEDGKKSGEKGMRDSESKKMCERFRK